MKLVLIIIDSLWRSVSQIGQAVTCSLVLLSLISCGSGGSSNSAPVASVQGSNVVTGTMPLTAVASREPVPNTRSFLAQLWNFLTEEPLAYAMSKGRVEVVGTSIKALPIGGGRFELIGVPDGPVTIRFTTPDGVTGTLTLNLPQGGGALVDLGTVIVKNDGRVEFQPSSANARFRSLVKARGKVSGVPTPVTVVPTDGTCPTFVVAGLTFCFDQNTRFDPPVNVANPFVNSDTTNNLIVDVIGEPTADPTSHVFHARRVQRNQGAPATVNEKIKALAPITNLGQGTITLFGGTTAAPDAHAITFNTASAKFEPGALKQNLAIGLFVEVLAGPVSTDQTGTQSSVASTVKLVRVDNDEHCSKGELLEVQGTISSLQPQSMTFGLNNDKLFVHIVDNATRFDDPLTSFDSLKIGQMLEVTALPPLTTGGPLQAVEVDLEDALGNAAMDVRGAISSLDTTKGTFVVAGITFCYNCNTVTTQFEGLSAATLANGQFVEVTGTALSNGISTALEVGQETDLRPSSCSDDEGRDDDNEQR